MPVGALLAGAPSADASAAEAGPGLGSGLGPARAASLARAVDGSAQASLAGGWDVVAPGDVTLSEGLWARLSRSSRLGGNGAALAAGQRLRLRRGEALQARSLLAVC